MTRSRTTPLGLLDPWAGNPRRSAEESSIEGLAGSIASEGLLQALVGRPHPHCPGRIQVIAGATRLAALKRLQAGKAVDRTGRTFDDAYPVPVVVQAMNDAEALAAAVAENAARTDMNAIDTAVALARMVASGLSPAEAGVKTGLSRPKVATALAIAALPDAALELTRRGDRPYLWAVALTQASKAMQHRIADEACCNAAAWPTVDSIKDALAAERIPACNALFDVDAAGLDTSRDLLDGALWITDATAFWALQNSHIEALACAAATKHASKRVTVIRDGSFEAWRHVHDPHSDAAETFIIVERDGSVEMLEDLRPVRTALDVPNASTQDIAAPVRPRTTEAEAEAWSAKAAQVALTPEGCAAVLVSSLLARLNIERAKGGRLPEALRDASAWPAGETAQQVLANLAQPEAAARRLAEALTAPLRGARGRKTVNPLAQATCDMWGQMMMLSAVP